jgi:antitoxin MazE
MKAAKIVQIGNSRGVRIPKELLLKYDLCEEVILKEHPEGVLIKCKKIPKLNWENAYKEMAKAKEDWSDWEALSDGLELSQFTRFTE